MGKKRFLKKVMAVVVTVSMIASLGLSAMAGEGVPSTKGDGANLSIDSYTVDREDTYYQVEVNYTATNIAEGSQITTVAYANDFSGTQDEVWAVGSLKTVAMAQEAYVADADSVDNTKISFGIAKNKVETEGAISDRYVIVRLGCEGAATAAFAVVDLNMANSWSPDTIKFIDGETETSEMTLDFATYGTYINGFEDADDAKDIVSGILSGYTMSLCKAANSVEVTYDTSMLSTAASYDPAATENQTIDFIVTVPETYMFTNPLITMDGPVTKTISVTIAPQDKFTVTEVKAFDAGDEQIIGVDYEAGDLATIPAVAKVMVYGSGNKSEEWMLTGDAWTEDTGKVKHTITGKINPIKGQNTESKQLELGAVTHSDGTDFYVASATAFKDSVKVEKVIVMGGETADAALASVQAAVDSVTVYGKYNNADKSETGWTAGTAYWSGTAPTGTLVYDAVEADNNLYNVEIPIAAPAQRGTYKGDNAGGITVPLVVQVIDGTQITGATFHNGVSEVTSFEVFVTDNEAAVKTKLQEATAELDVVVEYGVNSDTEAGWGIDQNSWTLTDNDTTWTAEANLVAPTEHTATIGAVTKISITVDKVIQLGDVDQDGDVDADDYGAVMDHINGVTSITGENNLAAADVTTTDDVITIWDAYYIARKANGEEDTLPIAPVYPASNSLTLKVRFTDNTGTEIDYISQGGTAKAVVYLENTDGSDIDFKIGSVKLAYDNVEAITKDAAAYVASTPQAGRISINTGADLTLKTVPATLDLATYNITIPSDATLGDVTIFTETEKATSNLFANDSLELFGVNVEDGTIEVVKKITANGYEGLSAKSVDFATTEADVLDLLDTEYEAITVTGDAESIIVPVAEWTCEDYDGTVAGTYTFTATLPEEYHDAANHKVAVTTDIIVEVQVTVNKIPASESTIEVVDINYPSGTGSVDVAALLPRLAATTATITNGTYTDALDASTIVWAADGGATSLDISTIGNSLRFTASVTVNTARFTGTQTAEVNVTVIDVVIADSSATVTDSYLNKNPIVTVTIPAEVVNGTDDITVTVKDADGNVKHTETQALALVPDQTTPYTATITLTDTLSEVGFIDGDNYTISVMYGEREIIGGATGTAADYVEYEDNTPPPGTNNPIISGGNFGGGSTSETPEEPETPETPEEPETPISGPFADVADDHWAAEYITILKDKGIVNGVSDTEYAPEASVTRAEFAKMIANVFGLELADAESIFADCEGEWFTSYVNAVYEAGYVTGVNETEFAPNSTITREQVCAVVGRALNKASESATSFTDAHSISEYAAAHVAALSEAGIINGYEDGSFAPSNSITRAEIAKILVGVLEYI